MQRSTPNDIYRALARIVWLIAGIIILLWLLYKTSGAVLLLIFAIVLALIINAPVTWLEQRKIKRIWASLIVFSGIFILLGFLGWLLIPKISDQLKQLIINLPEYADNLSRNISSWLKDYPEASQKIKEEGINLSQWLPSVPNALTRIGNYSLSLLSTIVLFIVFASMIVYAVANPRPLLEIYFTLFAPGNRNKAEKALINTSVMLTGWIRANLIGGAIEAVCTTIFLNIMHLPGAFVFGALTFFAELIPKIGFYIMAIPPILVGLSVSPITAVWILLFFIIMDEIMGDFVMPRLRSSTMNLHPVSTLFVLLAMGSAFGLIGALLATPLTAIIKAYYEEFYLSRYEPDKQLDKRIDRVIYLKGKTTGKTENKEEHNPEE